jgi:hypothetical protein
MLATKGKCRKDGCENERGVTSTGLDSLFCQYHIDLAARRLERFVQDHPSTEVESPGAYRETVRLQPPQAPAFQAPSYALCARCEQHPRAAGDSLCEDCRGG